MKITPPLSPIIEIFLRLKGYLPKWFGNNTPIIDALMMGVAQVCYFIFTSIFYVQLQTRVRTATDNNLDLISQDYFGNNLPRGESENDFNFKQRILANLIPEGATRPAMIHVLTVLTGYAPVIFEPSNIQDAAAYRSNYSGYGVARYGSGSLPYQCFIDVFADSGNFLSNVPGYEDNPAGYQSPWGVMTTASDITGEITDQQIYQTINEIKPEGTICWVRINRIQSNSTQFN
jgi:hypothetical protein